MNIYEYPPFNCSKKEFEQWSEKCIDKNPHLTWIGYTYWFLDNYSCALVLRNKEWFKEIQPILENVWNTIIKERVTGYDHRKPKKRVKKTVSKQNQSMIIKIDT